ncbi:MAG TPA: TonB-dependent receptor [Polyangiaceae bacterium]|nr:TonB-dependent receptor [Polyangiaceae bacterium]
MSLSRQSRIAWTLAVAQVVITAPALAQVGAAVLTGKVLDATSQAPVSDVVVTVTSPALQGEQMAVTDDSGSYRIPNLPPGEYTLRAEKDSFRPFSRGELTLRADATIRFDAQLLPEAIKGEEVVVQAQAPTVDVGSTNVGLSVSKEMMRRVPISPPTGKGAGSKSFEAVAAVAPGANADMFGTSINGASSPENAYIIDGVSANSPTHGTLAVPLSYEFMGEVNIISAGYMPEYGRSTGGIVNAVTKSGGNEFHGSVWGDYTPGGLATNPKPVQYLSTIQMTRKVNNIWDVGFDVGGPIQKDKLWFYVGFQYARTVFDLRRTLNRTYAPPPDMVDPNIPVGTYQEIPGTETIYPATSKDYQVLGKLTYSINQHNRLVLSLTATPTRSGGMNGGKEEFSINPDTGLPDFAYLRGSVPQGTYSAMANQTKIDSYGAVLAYTADFDNKHVLWDTTFGWRNQHIGNYAVDGSGPTDNRNPNTIAGTPFVIFRRNDPTLHPITDFSNYERPFDQSLCGGGWTCNVPLYVAGGPGLALGLVDRYINRYQFKSVLSYFGEAAGHHVIKGGFDGEFLTWRNVRGWPGGRRYREEPNGAAFNDYRAYGFLRAPDDPVILYNLDFTTKSLLLGGFVQDSWSVMDKVTVNIGGRYDAQLLYGPSGDLGLALANQWSPRIGVIYDPTQVGRMKIYGNYARLYESVPLDIADRSLSGEPGLSATYACDARDPTQLRTTCGTDAARTRFGGSTAASPDKQWFTTGAGLTPIDPDIKPQSSDELVLGAQYDVIANMRVGIDYTRRWLNYVIEDMSRDEAQTYFLGNPGYGIASDFPKATRNYDAVTFSLHRAFRDNWQATFSYTLSSLRGNIAGLFRPESGQLDPNINSDFDLRSMMANRQGPLAGDRRHQIKAFGSYEIELPNDMRVNLGGVLMARSGDPSNYLGAHPIYGQNEAYLLPRGSGERLPWMFSMDARAVYGIKYAQDKVIEVSLDVFNIFNFQAEVSRDQTYTSSDVLPIENGTEADLATKIRHASNAAAFLPGEKNPSFGKPAAYQPPRYVKFGLRTTF